MMNVLQKIAAIEAEARNWTANDGGLTFAATDILAFCEIARKKVSSGDRAGMIGWIGDPYKTDTGAESDLVSACLEWAGEADNG